MKREMKRRIAVWLLMALCFSMTGCGDGSRASNGDSLAAGDSASVAASGESVAPDKTAKPKATKTPKPTPKIDEVTLSCAGDCTIGTDPKFNYSTSLNAMVSKVGDKAYFFKNVQKYFAKDDMTLVNFEGTLTDRTTRADKTFTFKGPASFINIITKGNIESVAFANNHCRDFGQGSYEDTIATFKKAGVKYSSYSTVGTYTVKKEKTGTKIKIGMISVNGLEGEYASEQYIKKGIQKLKKKKCSLIVVSMHAGIERQYTPNGTQVNIAHYAVNAGADLVLGHHPHVLHGVEKYKGVYIVYSLGNFCFGGNSNPSDKDTMIARPVFTFKNGKLQKKKTTLKLIPCCLSSTMSYNNYQPTPKKGSERTRLLKKINGMCEALGTTLKDSNGKLTTNCIKK